MHQASEQTATTPTQTLTGPIPALRALAISTVKHPSWPVIAVLFGLLLRLSRYIFDDSLFNDESSLADNVLGRDFFGLMSPLSENQAAPVGFLFSLKLVSILFGPGEYALRLVPLLAGLISVVLFYYLAKRVLDPTPAFVAIALFASCWLLANYTHFMKQYSTDVAIASGISLAAVSIPPERARKPAALLAFAFLGSLAIWCSHPAIFILAGVAAAWIVRDWTCERSFFVWPQLLVPAAWVSSFLVNYWVSLRGSSADPVLLGFWREAFMPLPPRSASDWLWFPNAFRDAFASIDGTPAGNYFAILTCSLAVLGCIWFWRRDRFVLTLFTLPIALTLLASGLNKYPFSHRLILFLYPALILLLCAGLGRVLRLLPDRRFVAALVIGVVLGPPVAKAAYGMIAQPPTQSVKPLLRLIGEKYREGDLVWVSASATGLYDYYHDYSEWFPHAAFRNVCAKECHLGESETAAYEAALTKAKANRRVWVFAVFNDPVAIADERRLLERFDAIGTRIERIERRGAAVTLFELPR